MGPECDAILLAASTRQQLPCIVCNDWGGPVQEKKVAELLHDVTGDIILAKPANPARFIRDWMSVLVGPEQAEGETEEGSESCFFRVHVECGVEGKRVREHFSRRAP